MDDYSLTFAKLWISLQEKLLLCDTSIVSGDIIDDITELTYLARYITLNDFLLIIDDIGNDGVLKLKYTSIINDDGFRFQMGMVISTISNIMEFSYGLKFVRWLHQKGKGSSTYVQITFYSYGIEHFFLYDHGIDMYRMDFINNYLITHINRKFFIESYIVKRLYPEFMFKSYIIFDSNKFYYKNTNSNKIILSSDTLPQLIDEIANG